MKKKDMFWGLILILAAACVIINSLGIFVEISIFKIIVTIILAAIIIRSIRPLHFSGVLFPIAFLCILYDEAWNITNLTPWPVLLTALLLSIGLSMIFKNHKHNWCHYHEEHFEEVINQPDDNVVNCYASFSSKMKYVNSDNFERANIKCSFGAMKVYFDNAVINSGKADINLDVSFSGVELYIPKTWKIIDQTDSAFGAMSEKNRGGDSNLTVVTIRGKISFGGVEIIYI